MKATIGTILAILLLPWATQAQAGDELTRTIQERETIVTSYVLIDLDIHDEEGYSKYPPLVWPLIERHGGN